MAGPDGNLWVTDSGTSQIARIGANGLGLTTYTLPTKLSTPWGITAGPDGNLWFTESTAGQIGRITTGGVITEFSTGSAGSGPKGIVTGPDGNVWFTESGANILGRINPNGPRLPSPRTRCRPPAPRPSASPSALTKRSG